LISISKLMYHGYSVSFYSGINISLDGNITCSGNMYKTYSI
jgi:hypothetical protein